MRGLAAVAAFYLLRLLVAGQTRLKGANSRDDPERLALGPTASFSPMLVFSLVRPSPPRPPFMDTARDPAPPLSFFAAFGRTLTLFLPWIASPGSLEKVLALRVTHC